MNAQTSHPILESLIRQLQKYPLAVVLLGIGIALVASGGVLMLKKDTSVEAFIPPDHPSVLMSDRAEELFGLRDSIAVAVLSSKEGGIYNAEVLIAIQNLHQQISVHPNVVSERVMSIASESSIQADEDFVDILRYLDGFQWAEADLDAIRSRLEPMPPHVGTLVSADGTAALIVAELVDTALAADTYVDLQETVSRIKTESVEIHVAGQGAVSGYLSRYIDIDSRRLQPIVVLVILCILYLAFRQLRSLAGPVLVIAGSAGCTLGLMGWLGIPYFAITSALPVVLVAISVADSIHLLARYHELCTRNPGAERKTIVAEAVRNMWRPITLTTFTTAAGFAGIAITSIMPPITYFGWLAALGVLLAWLYSLTVLPSAMILWNLPASPAFKRWGRRGDLYSKALTKLALAAAERPRATVVLFTLIVVVAFAGAREVRVDRSQVENFGVDEPIRIATEVITTHLAGTSHLDVIISASEPGGLLEPASLQQMDRLQSFMEGLPNVTQVTSILDYLKALNRGIEGSWALPGSARAASQFLLVYESSADPGDLAEEIDPAYQHALIRAHMNSLYFSEEKPAVELLANFLDIEFPTRELTAAISGRVNVDFHWMQRLASGHFYGVAIALLFALVASIGLFRSVVLGLLAIAPVGICILVLYACMGIGGIMLEPATSMFAAISVGLGVDYAIHLLEQLRRAGRLPFGVAGAITVRYPGATRACFVNAFSLAAGFSVLLVSELNTLQRFGGLVATAAIVSFFAALFLIPAIVSLLVRTAASPPAGAHYGKAALLGATALLILPVSSEALDLDGRHVAEAVFNRPDGDASRRMISMEMTDRRGRTRTRKAQAFRLDEEDRRSTLIVYTEPKNVRATAFLSHQFSEQSKADNRWLYLPALRKARRIPASQRGDYFLGTDFTYEDINRQLKFSLSDYTFSAVEAEDHIILTATPRSQRLGKELGYGRLVAKIDPGNWLPMQIDFDDLVGRPLKTITTHEVREVDGVLTPLRIEAANHQTGHKTVFRYIEVEYPDNLAAELFNPTRLARGGQ